MLKKVAVVGLVLLLAGTAVLGWVLADRRREQQDAAFYKLKYGSELKDCLRQYNEWLQLSPEERPNMPVEVGKDWKAKTEVQLRQEQRGRLKADLDRLAAGETGNYPFANVLYGTNWQEELRNYKSRKERNEFILTGSIVCASAGGTLFVWCLLLGLSRLIIRGLSGLWKFFAGIFTERKNNHEDTKSQRIYELKKLVSWCLGGKKTRRETKDKTPAEDGAGEDRKQAGQKQKPSKYGSRPQLDTPRGILFEKRSKVLVHSGWQSFEANSVNRPQPAPAQADISIGGRGKITALLSDQESVAAGVPLMETSGEDSNVNMAQMDRTAGVRKVASSDSSKDFHKLEDSFKAQTENLEKQMAEVRQMAESVQQATLEHSKPLDNVLKELTQQMGAIREYAAGQQEKVKRLQDGYDWNIIKSFCLRVIRCIDNLEGRIARLSEQDVEAVNLKEVRDELVFLLESSGVEQFEPEVNSDYHGQERLAEAVKEKEYCYDRGLAGKIAEVIRAGYQYFIDDENSKVVRPAQVKLFG